MSGRPTTPRASTGEESSASPAAETPETEADTEWMEAGLEALLFSSPEPLTAARLASLLGGGVSPADVRRSLDRLRETYDRDGRSFALEEVAHGYRLATRLEFAGVVSRLFTGRRKARLTRAGLETLAIVAYKQPVTRQQIEGIRGVDAGGVLATLLERNLIRIQGRSEAVGRPFLFGTSRHFLEYLGLKDLRDLPRIEELEALLDQREVEREVRAEVEARLGTDDDDSGEQDDREEEETSLHMAARAGRDGSPGGAEPARLPADDGAPLEDLGEAMDRAERTLRDSSQALGKKKGPARDEGPPEGGPAPRPGESTQPQGNAGGDGEAEPDTG
jgi:segregation and condensation protein B